MSPNRPLSPYPAFGFYWLDEGGAAHGLCLYHVVIEEQLNVIHSTQDAHVLQTHTCPVRATHGLTHRHGAQSSTQGGRNPCLTGMEFLFSSLKMFLKTQTFHLRGRNHIVAQAQGSALPCAPTFCPSLSCSPQGPCPAAWSGLDRGSQTVCQGAQGTAVNSQQITGNV